MNIYIRVLLNILLLSISTGALENSGNDGRVVFSGAGKFLVDFLPATKHISRVVAYLCWKRDSMVNLVKTLSSKGYYTLISTDCVKNDTRIQNDQNILYILDLSCPMAKSCIDTVSNENLFRFPFKWIILSGFFGETDDSQTPSNVESFPEYYFQYEGENCDGETSLEIQLDRCPSKFIKQIPLYADNDVVFAKKKPQSQNVNLFSMYKMKRMPNLTVWENYGYWNPHNGLVDKRLNRITSARRLKVPKGPVIIGVVIEYNRSYQHLEYDSERHIEPLSKINYVLATDLVNFLNGTAYYDFQQTWGVRVNGTYNGMIGRMINDNSDIGSTPMFINKRIFSHMEFISMTIKSNLAFVFKQPSLSTVTNVFLLPFQWTVWISGLFYIIIACITLYFTSNFEKLISKSQKCFNNSESETKTEMSEICLLAVGAVAQQGCAITPLSTPGKLANSMLFFAVMFLYVSYSANIVALLHSHTGSIKTLSDLLSSDIQLGSEDNFYNKFFFPLLTDPVRKAIYEKKIAPPDEKPHFYSMMEGIKLMRKGMFGFHMECGIGYKFINDLYKEEEKCGLEEIIYLELTLPYNTCSKKFPLCEMVKVGMRRIKETGLESRENMRFYDEKPECTSKTFESVGLVEIRPALIFIGSGFCLAIIVFIFEIMIYYSFYIRYRY